MKENIIEQTSRHPSAEKSLEDEHFFIKETNGITKLFYGDVLYIESLGDFSKLYTIQNERYITLVSLKNLEKQLPEPLFRRIHKQFIVNMSHIVTISVNTVVMDNKVSIPLGTQYKQQLMNQVINKKITSRYPG